MKIKGLKALGLTALVAGVTGSLTPNFNNSNYNLENRTYAAEPKANQPKTNYPVNQLYEALKKDNKLKDNYIGTENAKKFEESWNKLQEGEKKMIYEAIKPLTEEEEKQLREDFTKITEKEKRELLNQTLPWKQDVENPIDPTYRVRYRIVKSLKIKLLP